MPKTRNAFAFRDFDKERIIERQWIYNCRQNLAPDTRIQRFCDVDKNILSTFQTHFLDDIKNVQYANANKETYQLQLVVDAIEKYSARIARHVLRLKKYSVLLGSRINLLQVLIDDDVNDAPNLDIPLIKKKAERALNLFKKYSYMTFDLAKIQTLSTALLNEMFNKFKEKAEKVFPSRLRVARKKLKMTQKQVATRLGIYQSSYTQYENAKREPSLEMLARIARVLNCSVDWLLGLTP